MPSGIYERKPKEWRQGYIQKVEWDGQRVAGTHLKSIQEKRFAKNFIKYKGNKRKAVIETFGEDYAVEPNNVANALLAKDGVRKYIAKFEEKLISDERVAEEINAALETPTPKKISWSDKHQYIETVLKLRGHLNTDKPQVNIGMVIKE